MKERSYCEGQIIVLNGASSAGKSSIAQQLQQQFLPRALLHLGLDHFMHFLPQAFFALDPEPDHPAHQGLRWVPPLDPQQRVAVRRAVQRGDGDPLAKYELFAQALRDMGLYDEVMEQGVQIVCGEAVNRVMAGLHESIAAMSRTGNDVVVDYVKLESHWLSDLVRALAGLPVVLVGAHCPLAELERRERERGYRMVGQARGHWQLVHEDMRYDLELDTSRLSPEESARRIIGFIEGAGETQAFAELSALLDQGD